MSFTLEKLIQRKHIFKKRTLTSKKRLYRLRCGNAGYFILSTQRFELVYLRGVKKLLKRRYIRIKPRFKYRKYWVFLNPNVIFSGKSVNSRMGAGVGSYVRASITLKSYTSFLEFTNYSFFFLKKLAPRIQKKYPLVFTIIKIVMLYILKPQFVLYYLFFIKFKNESQKNYPPEL